MNSLTELKTVLSAVKWIVASELTLDDKYDMVFSSEYSGKVVKALKDLGQGYHFVAPEYSGADERLEAFVCYLTQKIAELEKKN